MGECGLVESSHLGREDGERIVDSWKGIAAYFGVTFRTVQHWEQENGLPVHRQPGVRGRVFAYVSELAAWRSPRRAAGSAEHTADPGPARGKWRRIGLFAVAATVLMTATAVIFVAARPGRGHPALHSFEGPFFVVMDQNGSEMWRRRLPAAPNPSFADDPNTIPPLFADLDADGNLEVLLAFQQHGSSSPDVLFCYSASGGLLWTFHPGRVVHTSAEHFARHYRLRSLTVLPAENGRKPRLLVNSRHEPNYPTQMVALNGKGEIQAEYWHSGHFVQSLIADLDRDGSSEIILAGISNGEKAANLVVLNSAGFNGASGEINPAYQIQGMPLAVERARILLPRTRVSQFLDHYAIPTVLLLDDSHLRLDTSDFTGGHLGS